MGMSIMGQNSFELGTLASGKLFKQGLVHNDLPYYLLASWCKVGSEACLYSPMEMWSELLCTVWIRLPRPAKAEKLGGKWEWRLPFTPTPTIALPITPHTLRKKQILLSLCPKLYYLCNHLYLPMSAEERRKWHLLSTLSDQEPGRTFDFKSHGPS